MKLFERQPKPAPKGNPKALAEMTWPTDPLAVDRRSALGLSVVANAVGLIVGIASQLSVNRYRGEEEIDNGTILTQPDPDETWSTTIGQTVDDLFFIGESYWLVLRRDTEGYPTRARRLPMMTVYQRLDPDYGRYSRVIEYAVSGVTIPARDIIRFKVPGAGLLRDEAKILLAALTLQAAADRFVNVPLPAGVLTNTGQEIGDADALKIVQGFDSARETGATAFLQSMTYERTQLNAQDLALTEAVAAMDTRLARACNVPVVSVAASPSGGAHAQLYANVGASFVALIQTAVAPYLVAIEQTFTDQGVTPRNQTVKFDTEDWLRFTTIATPTGIVPGDPGGALVPGADPQPNDPNAGGSGQ